MAPSRERNGNYICSRCFHRSPGGQARLARYNAGAARKAVHQQHNHRRIMIGATYHSAARTVEDAKRINAYIKRKLADLRSTSRET